MDDRIMSVEGGLGRVIAAVLLQGVDLITGIEELCIKHGIKHGLVFSIGSATHSGIHYVRKDDTVPSGAVRVHVDHEGIQDFTNIFGLIMKQGMDGSFTTHLHGTICKEDGTICGGHLHKGKNISMTNLAVVILETTGIEMLNVLDPVTGFYHFEPKAMK
jgi:predicted DNA-binding protein with PD1-like motif